jgi:hypothetical protein
MNRFTTVVPTALALCLAAPVFAQEISTCDDWRSSAFALAEPWESTTRLFANGEVRLAMTDTIEPAAAAFHLIILSPPYDEVGGRQCAVVSTEGGMGFAGLNVAATKAKYDPTTGLAFTIPATRWLPETDSYVDAVLHVTLNQATGAITAVLD